MTKHISPFAIMLLALFTGVAVVFVLLTLGGLSAETVATKQPATAREPPHATTPQPTTTPDIASAERVLPWESNPYNTPAIPDDSASVPAWQIPSRRPLDEPPRAKPVAPDPWTRDPAPRN